MESSRELVDRLKGCLEDICQNNKAEIRRKKIKQAENQKKTGRIIEA